MLNWCLLLLNDISKVLSVSFCCCICFMLSENVSRFPCVKFC